MSIPSFRRPHDGHETNVFAVGVLLKPTVAVVCSLILTGALLGGCSKGGSSSGNGGSTATGPVTDMNDSGLRAKPGATSSLGDAQHGSAIFAQNCVSCHGAQGAGGGIGPRLKGEKQRKNYQQAIAWIKNPQPPMPKLYPSPLSESDVNDVAAYVETL